MKYSVRKKAEIKRQIKAYIKMKNATDDEDLMSMRVEYRTLRIAKSKKDRNNGNS